MHLEDQIQFDGLPNTRWVSIEYKNASWDSIPLTSLSEFAITDHPRVAYSFYFKEMIRNEVSFRSLFS